MIRLVSYVRGSLLSFMMFTARVAIFASLALYVILGNAIEARTAFVVTAYYNLLRTSMTMLFPQGIYQLAETLVSVKRIEKFMLYEELDNNKSKAQIVNESGEKSVKITKATAKWDKTHQENTLEDININIEKDQLVAVIGPVGSGKSSIFQAILGELQLDSGDIRVDGKISYACQEPWLFSASIRQNILFGLPFDRERYRAVVKNCALERDFTLFPNGDRTIIGERGASLSGGQRARVNLARAIYRKASVYLLDDPLSAVDAHVGKNISTLLCKSSWLFSLGRHLFDQCIKRYLKGSITILVTHQVQYLQDADLIVLMEHGKISAIGTYHELSNSGLDFTKLLATPEETEDETNHKKLQTQVSKISIANDRRTSVLSSTSIDDEQPNTEEKRDEGGISYAVSTSAFDEMKKNATFQRLAFWNLRHNS